MKRVTAILVFSLIAVLVAAPAWSQARLGFRGAGLELDVVDPENIDTVVGFGAFADLGSIAQNVRLEPYMKYWSKSEEAFGVRASANDLNFGARSKYMFRVSNPRLLPFAGGGLGMHFISSEVTIAEQDLGGGLILPETTYEESTTKIGLDLGGGLLYNLNGRASLMSEVWYSMVNDVNQLSLELGLVWHFALK